MKRLENLETPEEFIQFYYNQIKDSLNIDDININRLGFIGFIFELLGNLQYDVKNYFDNLFVEAFPITATNNENLIYHSHVHGYIPQMATPSVVQGVIKFDFSRFPLIPYSAKRRDILLSDNEFPINFILNGMNYYLDAEYRIIFERLALSNSFRINCEIKSDDEYQVFPILQSNPTVAILNLKQYSKFEQNYKIPNYNHSSYYTISIPMTEFLYEIEVSVKEYNSEIYETYAVRYTKSFALSDEKIVFLKLSAKNEIILELGSGINGKYIPNSDIKIVYKTTKGKVGNISTNAILPSGKIRISDVDFNNRVDDKSSYIFTFNPTSNNFVELLITGSYDGKDAEVNQVLRSNLVKYIQSKDNLVSELDFENEIKSYFDVCEILFKKTDIIENVIYCYIPLYDRLLNPIKTLTTSLLLSDFENNKMVNPVTNDILIYEPTVTIKDVEFTSPFLYIYDKLLNLYKGFFVIENNTVNFSEKVTLTDINFSISIFIEIEFLGLKSRIWVRSYADISNFKFKILSQVLMFNYSDMIQSGNSFYIDYNNKLVDADSNMSLFVYDTTDTALFEFKFKNVKSVYSFSKTIRLKPIPLNGDYYIVNLPLIEKEIYNSEKSYYQDKLLTNIQKLSISTNRMLSDEIQLRFLNSYYVDQIFVKDLILQYTVTPDIEIVNYFLPFKLEINIDFAKDLILSKNRDITDEAETILSNITEYLLQVQTGLNVSFYKTKIIDIIHNNDYVKHASVILKDAKNNLVVNSNFENNNNKTFIEKLNKENYLHYSPIYYWFDLNNIKYTLKAYD
jgi:hypothetical protein